MLKVNSSERFGWKFGSNVSAEPTATSFAPGNHGCGRLADGFGSGALNPSKDPIGTPTRTTVLGSPPQPPLIFGPPQVSGCIKPGVSMGTRMGLTPLIRPKMRA